MRAFDLSIASGVVLGLATALAACSSSAAGACGGVDGTYAITVSGTGQNEISPSIAQITVSDADSDGGLTTITGAGSTACPGPEDVQVIDLTVSHGQVSLNGETCSICASAGCSVDIVCGDSVTCPDTVTPPVSPADTYVQTLTFVIPSALDASTGNAAAALGPNFCGYEGTAVLKSH